MDIKKVFAKYNIDAVGVTGAERYNTLEGTDFSSVIVALFPYFCGYDEDANLSIYTHGTDYHIVIKDILTAAAEELGLIGYAIHSDIGPEIERYLAVSAGLCFVGRNGMCINEKYGSYFFIGYIACRENLGNSHFEPTGCKNCMACVRACPGGALDDGFCEEKCLSAITQKKQPLTDGEKVLIKENGTVFGCDICQRVCPHNKNAQTTPIVQFADGLIKSLSLADIEHLSNREFKEKYRDRAFAWRGKKVLERNLKIIEDKD